MFSSKDPNASIKVIDFGLSKKYLDPSINITDYVGTVYTMAPEVINRIPYSYKADMFSVGVISYMLLSGCKPFWASTRKEIAEKVKNCDYSLSSRYWYSISEEAKDFVSKLIEKDPDRRLSAKDAKDHPWLKQNHIDPSNGSHLVHSEHIEKSLINFADSGEFKKLVLNVLAHQVSAEDIKYLETIFKSYDKDNNGYITHNAFKDALSRLSNLSDETKENMFQSLVSLEMCCEIIAVFISPLHFLNF
jgi:calcium-dependent protein kinase